MFLLHNSGRYYFRLWIPLDLRVLFSPYLGARPDIAYSLKTSAQPQAKTLALKPHKKRRRLFLFETTSCLIHSAIRNSRRSRSHLHKPQLEAFAEHAGDLFQGLDGRVRFPGIFEALSRIPGSRSMPPRHGQGSRPAKNRRS